jgi:uncharacterized membrane protein YfcA
MFGIPAQDLVWLAFALLAGGAITGFMAGIFGVGGGTVAVPVLYELFRVVDVPEEVRLPLCIGTSLAIIIPTSIRSFMTHRSKGAVDMMILRMWAVPVVTGVIVGSLIARYAPEQLFKIVFVVVVGFASIRLLFGKDTWRLGTDLPSKPITLAYGWLIGVLSALMGIGGGLLSSMFMTFYSRPIHQAVATSSGLGILISIPGAIGYIYAGWPRAAEYPAVAALQQPLAYGYVSVLGLLLFIPTSVWMAPIGARMAHRLSKRKLETAFGIFLLVICLRFLLSLVG